MNAVTEAALDQTQVGLYRKFEIKRTDGKDLPGQKHEFDEYFVLNLTTDKNALPALAAYAKSCEEQYPILAQDLRAKLKEIAVSHREFIVTPQITLPSGIVVEPFKVGKYHSSKGIGDTIEINPANKPWVEISYNDTRKVVADSGLNLITELQYLALAHDIVNQDENWTGGKVGEGKVFQGLHKGNVSEAQDGLYESTDPEERRWHVLSNGEKIYDMAGNVFSWVFNDINGDENGLVAGETPEDSPTRTTPPFGNREKGIGDWVVTGNWSGRALVRGGYWGSDGLAGVFYLGGGWPHDDIDYVGFRCTETL